MSERRPIRINPVPTPDSRWMNTCNSKRTYAIVVDRTYWVDERKDTRIEYHSEGSGKRGEAWHSTFRLGSRFRPAPLAATPPAAQSPAPEAAAVLRVPAAEPPPINLAAKLDELIRETRESNTLAREQNQHLRALLGAWAPAPPAADAAAGAGG